MTQTTATSVYQYFDEFEVLLYAGITSRRDIRQAEHSRSKHWWQFVDHQTVEHYPSRGDALAREAELIARHQPPFNTQLNAAADAQRNFYLSFRERAQQVADPLDYWRLNGKRIPLEWVSGGGTTATLCTLPEAASLVRHLDYDGQPKLTLGSIRCGHLVDITRRGPLAFITFDCKAGVEPSAVPNAKVKYEATKRGPRFLLTSAHI